ncbi:MAG TPA: MBOAT family O-acyltransferase [Minicystis sp.]|nr:MBOAT family O-acyltransferase [Minicystis sp.]
MITSAIFWGVLLGGAVVYWLLPRWREQFLFVLSAGYVAYLDYKVALWLLGFSVLSYYSTQKLDQKFKYMSLIPAFGVGAYLAFYKYIPPILAQATHKASGKGAATFVVPLGASYFTFKIIHYVIECRRGHMKPHKVEQFLSYMFFLPMYTAGPIERFDEYLKNRTDKVSFDLVARGGTRIVYGLIKKFVVVDLILNRHASPTRVWEAVPLVMPSYAIDKLVPKLATISPVYVWQFCINHFIGWYLDFSAYCDIAIGLGLLFGIKLVENFEWSFLVTNVSDFWKRYHISLSNWAQRYVYFPMLGWTRNAQLALFATMIMIGLWHAGNLNYLAWGTYQACLLSLNLVWTRYKRRRIGREEDGSPFNKLVEHPVFGFAGGIVTALGICASSALPSTQAYGLVTGLRVLGALVGIHVHTH